MSDALDERKSIINCLTNILENQLSAKNLAHDKKFFEGMDITSLPQIEEPMQPL